MKTKIPIDLAKVEQLASQGLTQEQIAASLGICVRTLQKRKNENAEVAEAVKRGQAKGIAFVTNKLMQAVKNGNITAMIFYLKTKGGWSEKQLLDVTTHEAPPEGLEEIYAKLTSGGNNSGGD